MAVLVNSSFRLCFICKERRIDMAVLVKSAESGVFILPAKFEDQYRHVDPALLANNAKPPGAMDQLRRGVRR